MTDTPVFRIWTHHTDKQMRPIFWDVISGHATLRELVDRLNTGDILVVEHLFTRHSTDEEGRCLVVWKRVDRAITKSDVKTIDYAIERFVQYVEDAKE